MNLFAFSAIVFGAVAFFGMRLWNARGNMQDALGAIGVIAAGLLGLCGTGVAWSIEMIFL
ncbi:MAG TPA: hypothetical protein VGE12_10630 [Noviherbaspirillum sp.]